MASEKYTLLMYYVHSYLESVRAELKITDETTVDNFRNAQENERHCNIIFQYCLKQWEYELSYNQVANGIDLLLKARTKQKEYELKKQTGA